VGVEVGIMVEVGVKHESTFGPFLEISALHQLPLTFDQLLSSS
jgi:hypothetical protein